MAEFFDEAAKKPLLAVVPTWIHPNYLSVTRALLAVPVILLKDKPALAVSFLVLSSICDLLDGPLARVRGQKSAFGAWLDTMSDKVFVLSVMYLACFDRIPVVIVAAVTTLEASLVVVRIIKERFNVKTDSNQFGAAKTWLQSFSLAFILSGNPFLYSLSSTAFGVATSAACFSLLFHLRDFSRRHPA
jgi:CDP-diacylglycerol--glycerol-3-phosphate 3-phosphatidyltransferase